MAKVWGGPRAAKRGWRSARREPPRKLGIRRPRGRRESAAGQCARRRHAGTYFSLRLRQEGAGLSQERHLLAAQRAASKRAMPEACGISLPARSGQCDPSETLCHQQMMDSRGKARGRGPVLFARQKERGGPRATKRGISKGRAPPGPLPRSRPLLARRVGGPGAGGEHKGAARTRPRDRLAAKLLPGVPGYASRGAFLAASRDGRRDRKSHTQSPNGLWPAFPGRLIRRARVCGRPFPSGLSQNGSFRWVWPKEASPAPWGGGKCRERHLPPLATLLSAMGMPAQRLLCVQYVASPALGGPGGVPRAPVGAMDLPPITEYRVPWALPGRAFWPFQALRPFPAPRPETVEFWDLSASLVRGIARCGQNFRVFGNSGKCPLRWY